jgi:hypothetical protein
MGEELPAAPAVGRTGVRTHGTIALLLGAAAYQDSRRAVMAELVRAATRRGCYRASGEQLTPVIRDPPSAAALAFVIAQALFSPRQATRQAGRAVGRYSITAEAIGTVAAAGDRV